MTVILDGLDTYYISTYMYANLISLPFHKINIRNMEIIIIEVPWKVRSSTSLEAISHCFVSCNIKSTPDLRFHYANFQLSHSVLSRFCISATPTELCLSASVQWSVSMISYQRTSSINWVVITRSWHLGKFQWSPFNFPLLILLGSSSILTSETPTWIELMV